MTKTTILFILKFVAIAAILSQALGRARKNEENLIPKKIDAFALQKG